VSKRIFNVVATSYNQCRKTNIDTTLIKHLQFKFQRCNIAATFFQCFVLYGYNFMETRLENRILLFYPEIVVETSVCGNTWFFQTFNVKLCIRIYQELLVEPTWKVLWFSC
jgi:hypothetical protein